MSERPMRAFLNIELGYAVAVGLAFGLFLGWMDDRRRRR